MSLRPLGHRVLVKPDVPPDQTDSGLILMRDRHAPEMSGDVVAVGNGPAAAHRIRTKTIERCMKILDETSERVPSAALRTQLMEELARYLMEQVNLSDVVPGDHVCFSYTAGTLIEIDGEKLILLNEDDLAAVWTPDEAEMEQTA